MQALKGVSLKIHDGALVAILGENGAGKTTLIRHFNGLLKPQRGVVLVDGEDTRNKSVAQLARRVGLVFQNPENQLFSETVEKEVEFALRNFGFPENEIKRRVKWALEEFGLSEYRNKSPFALSSGEKKRLALASVLCYDPDVLVLDEPTIGQDAKQKERLASLLHSLNRRGKSIVVVTHDVEFVADYIKEVFVLSKGKVLAKGSAEEIFLNQDVLNASNLLPPQIVKVILNLSGLITTPPRTLNLEHIKGELLKVAGALK